jgi:hypothetical protein
MAFKGLEETKKELAGFIELNKMNEQYMEHMKLEHEKEVRKLKLALIKYGRHSDACATWCFDKEYIICSCGYDEAAGIVKGMTW